MKRIERSLKLLCKQGFKEVENYMASFVHLMCQNLNLLDVTLLLSGCKYHHQQA